MRATLKPGGQLTIWVYGREGNRLYLATFGNLRRLTSRMPHRALHWMATGLALLLRVYIAGCRLIALPMHQYVRRVLAKLDFKTLRVVVYDQLNPKLAKYWTEQEVYSLMTRAGFKNIRLYHRHAYSWTGSGVS